MKPVGKETCGFMLLPAVATRGCCCAKKVQSSVVRTQGAKVRAGVVFLWLEGLGSGVTSPTQRPEVWHLPKDQAYLCFPPSPASPEYRAIPFLWLRMAVYGHRSGSQALSSFALTQLCYFWQITDFRGPQFPQLTQSGSLALPSPQRWCEVRFGAEEGSSVPLLL